MRSKTAFFHGEGYEKFDYSNDNICTGIFINLSIAILTALKKGYRRFMIGGSPGFDVLSSLALRQVRIVSPSIKLVCVLPYKGYCYPPKYWRETCRCDRVFSLSKEKSAFNDCFAARNRYMADKSSLLICLHGGDPGEMQDTIIYAANRGVEVVNIIEW